MDAEPKYAIFDLDGMLVDSVPSVTAACEMVARDLGRTLAVRDNSRMRQAIAEHAMERLFCLTAAELGLPPGKFRLLYDEALMKGGCSGDRLITSSMKALCAQRRLGHKIVVLTNKRQEIAERECRRFGLETVVDAVIGRRGPAGCKGSTRVLGCMRSAGVDPNLCVVYYGDSDLDRSTAETLGVPFVDVRTQSKFKS